jgi:homoserine dehydrogenase
VIALQPVNIGILGLGNVGAATLAVLQKNANEITRRAGRSIRASRATVREVNKIRECDLTHIHVDTDPQKIVNDPEISIVVELLGGIEPAKTLILKAIASGKHVVTANKALIATHGNEIFSAAHQRGVMVAFEAAVAGGIPIIKAVREGLTANRIDSIAGIINGTSNYILTEMREQKHDFNEVLEQAQKRGYAEADPRFDIEGIDIAHKLTILAAIAFGIPLQFQKTYTEGINKITQEDISYAEELGYRIKQLGIAKQTDEGIELRVHPVLVRRQHVLASIHGVMNAILINGDVVGDTIYSGPGAGGLATASAVIADLVDVVRVLTVDPENRVPHLAFQPDALKSTPILSIEEITCANYLRLHVADQPGVLASIAEILAQVNISIEALIQKEPAPNSSYVPIVILTKMTKDGSMQKAIQQIRNLSMVDNDVLRIRLY